MAKPDYDVIIAGGGPAGSMTAYHLAKAGLRVAVMDAKKFPREKPCGGGLQARARRHIPFDVSHVLRGAFEQVQLTFDLKDSCTRTYPEPLVYCVLRSEFDNYLIEQAGRAGAVVRSGVRVLGFSRGNGLVSAHTEQGEVTGYCLVGADGANSTVSRALNQREDYFWQVAVYCEVPEDWLRPRAVAPDSMRIDWGSLPSGYAWVFPKRGYVNIGAGGPPVAARLLKRYVTRFLESTELLEPSRAGGIRLTGHQLPTLTRRTRLADARVLLVGDAAGLVDPFTGDGISLACQSAARAAGCIGEALDGPEPDLSGYEHQMKAEVGPELLLSRKLLSLSVAFPGLIYWVFRHNDRVWRTFCRILRGEETFLRLKSEILGPLEFAWKAIDFVTQRRERRVLSPGSLPALLKQFSA
jgi:geranylgeranyl reductase family protein